MTIELAKDVERFIRQHAGKSNDANELVNDLLRSFNEQKTLETSVELEQWLLQAANKPATPLSPSDFDAIRHRAKRRAKRSS